MLEFVTGAWQGDHRTRNTCVLVALDVKNAFNSVRWVDILDALGRFGVRAYQFLPGHGHFNRYLFRRGIKVKPLM